ncbi:MAG TPA: NAD(P)/FAD-dependent oxidoreductase [Thermoplasmata archaeon]|nr:NAD(P)/FAD-dependent oxidoreductase [Thermoplasmata archaeon]
MDLDVDVLVVGGGPTGSMAAKAAALGGARTLMIEKRQEIGTPVRCGEGVGKHWLAEAGVRESREYIAHEVKLSRIFSPDGSCFTIDSLGVGKSGFVVERDLFDRFLAKDASKAGAEILIKTSAVDLLREDGVVVGARCQHMGQFFDVRARLVIGADGFESQVGRWAGLTTRLRMRDVASCLQYTLAGIRGEPDAIDFHLGSQAPGGYLWVFWKGDDIANVGIGVCLAKLHDRAEVKGYLDAFVARHPQLAQGEVIEEVAGGVSASMPVAKSVTPGLLLAGDAARLIDPLSGAGILNGLLSGKWAGETAVRALAADDVSETFLMDYERRWRARMEEELARHYLVKEGLQRTDDASIDKIVRAVAESGSKDISAKGIVKVVLERCPETLKGFQGLLV